MVWWLHHFDTPGVRFRAVDCLNKMPDLNKINSETNKKST
jgi:hypothetical protein